MRRMLRSSSLRFRRRLTTSTIFTNISQTTFGALREFAGPDPRLKSLEGALQAERDEANALRSEIESIRLEQEQQEEAAKKAEASTYDPILGKMIADLGDKKLYLASVETLQEIPMWEKQRAFRDERAKAIASDKKNSVVKNTFPGILTAYRFKQTQKIGLLDGQHRLGAFKHMTKNGLCDPKEKNVLIEVFELNDGKQADRLFIEINKAEPVKSIDMPGEVNPNVKATIDEAVDELKGTYSEMFKVSSKCLAPHVHQDTLREDLFEADVCGRQGLRDKGALMRYIMDKNEKMGAKTDEEWLRQKAKRKSEKAFLKALEKARKHNFFLGMNKDWF
mmetsp:Transcript_9399/g.13000  ORF Transcript_9399/g.13000 Transcript_9399/m.13000 type:complete len:335 (-) Transcript_9399:181-1185(-)